MNHPGLRLPALRDVAGIDDDPANARVGQEIGDCGLDPAPRAVSVAGAVVEGGLRPWRFRYLAEDALDPRRVTGVEQGNELLADQVLGPDAEHPLDCRTHVAASASGIQDGDDVGRVLDQRAETGLACS